MRALLLCCTVLAAACLVACGGAATPATNSTKTAEPITIYAPISEMACATDPNFLDASPLTSPANFARVAPGTQLIIMSVGGIYSGKMYYTLSAGGRQQIYVYRDVFEQKFTAVGKLNDSDDSEKEPDPKVADEDRERERKAIDARKAKDEERSRRTAEAQRLAAERKVEEQRLDRLERTRKWTSKSGTTTEAEFVRYSNGKVFLRKADESEIEVGIEKLSDDDKAWIEGRRH